MVAPRGRRTTGRAGRRAARMNPVTEAFEAQRDRQRAIAYRVLGSHTDAEDMVQEAWLRLSRQYADTIANLAGRLTTVVGRLRLDLLRVEAKRTTASCRSSW
ncbi:sigma factor [Amycolatopsis thermoflava]|uniref:sigma factor n=1 Tax=Amycolatopsis thermoflava TaxID=84480 RepID=UPI000429CC58|nr:sigma factor [Amycolatopsis thermoflava]